MGATLFLSVLKLFWSEKEGVRDERKGLGWWLREKVGGGWLQKM